jgi:hypothetical protein
VTALAAVSTFLNPNEKSSIHVKAANKYNVIREQLRTFYEIDTSLHQDKDVQLRRLNEFREQKDELDKDSPQIPHWAYKRSKRGAEAGEGCYKIDDT